MPAAPAASPCPPERGQAMVEFAAVLMPALLIIVGIIQFGLIFGANVTLTNAAREAARAATIARYDVSSGITRADNDLDRCTSALDAARNSFGLMTAAAPNFTATRPCPIGSATDLNADGFADRWVNGDFTISLCATMATPTSPCPTTGTYCAYDDPSGPPAGDPCLVQVTLTYRSDIIVPLIGDLIGRDSGGRFVQSARATMVVN
jgi:Flp pilus assembly protein TadG